MPPSLDGCLLKVERAKEHRDALEMYERETFSVESNRPRLGIKLKPDKGDYVFFINYMPDLDDFLARSSLILGDAVHNLRSALDRLAYQLALLHTGENIQRPDSIQFPICDSIGAFSDAKDRRLREIAPDHVAIMERFQGYHRVDGGQAVGPYFHPLSKLRDLANVDKHRLPINLLIPMDSITSPASARIVEIFVMDVVGQVLKVGSFKPPIAELGAEVMRFKLPSPPTQAEMGMAGYVSPNIAIEGENSAVVAVDKIAAMVVKVISEFEPVF